MRTIRYRHVLLPVCFILLIPFLHAQRSGEKPVAAVLEFESRLPGESVDTVGLTDIFQTAFVQAGSYRMVERGKLDSILSEQELQLSGITESGAARIGFIAGAGKVVLPSVTKIGSKYILSARCIDSVSGVVDVAATVTAQSLDEMLRLIPELAFRLSGKVPEKSAPSGVPLASRRIVPAIGIAFWSDGQGITDEWMTGLNEVALEGLRRVAERYRGYIENDPAEARYGDTLRIRYRVAGRGENQLDSLRALAKDGNTIVYVTGFMFDDAVRTAASEFPSVRFIMLDSDLGNRPTPPNLSWIMFNEPEGCFLAGALAALWERDHGSGKIGFLGGMDLPIIRRFRAGFISGAAATDRRYLDSRNIAEAWIGSFGDTAAGKRTAEKLYSGGADIVFHAAGVAGTVGAVETASARRKAVIGVDADQGLAYAGSPDPAAREKAAVIVSSMVKRYDEAILRSATAILSSGFFPSGRVELGIADDGLTLAENNWNRAIMERYRPQISVLIDRIIRGEIKVPTDDASLAAFLGGL